METGLSRTSEAVKGLSPGYFALVMATGIISLGLHLEQFEVLSTVLFAIAVVAYLVLVVLTIWRLSRFPRAAGTDFASPHTGFAFFTFVAGTNVLGTRLVAADNVFIPGILLAVSFAAWLVLGYLIPGSVISTHVGDDILRGVNGTWFIWSVASQSIAVLSASLQPTAGAMGYALSILAVLSWGIGVILYGVIGVAVVIRVLTRGIPPEQLGLPYWVMMGAGAIAVLAGARIVEMGDTAMVTVVRASVAAAAVVFWAFATWLIPALAGIGYWRHRVKNVPVKYEPALWSMVFPLGMYAVAGIYLGEADSLPVLEWVGRSFLWVAFAVWAVVFVWMLVHLIRLYAPPRRHPVSEA